jgi:hypothetical protein
VFLRDIELDDDPFLSDLQAWQQHRIIGAFASAYRDGRFSPKHDPSKGPAVISKTVRAAIDAVAATFRDNYCVSPAHDVVTTKLAFVLRRQLKGYTNQDPAERPQKALTPRILRELTAINSTTLDVAINELTRGAFAHALVRIPEGP